MNGGRTSGKSRGMWELYDGETKQRELGTVGREGGTEGGWNCRTVRRDRGTWELENGEKEQKEG